MVNVNKERDLMEAEITIIGNGNLATGYAKIGLPNKYLQGGSARRRLTEVRNKINNYSAPKEEPAELDEIITDKKTYTKDELEDKDFKELKEIGNSMGTTGRGKNELINEILEIQENQDE